MVEKSDQTSVQSKLTPEFKELREILNGYLSSLKLPFVAPNSAPASDHPLYDDCMQYMYARNWSPTTIKMLQTFLPAGQAVDLAYAHLPSDSTRTYLIIYSSFLQFVDDVCPIKHIDALASFGSTMLKGGSHGNDFLDAFAEHIREMPRYFNKVTGDLMLTCTLRYVSAIVLEDALKRNSRCASKTFPLYLRGLTAVPEAYALFAFPTSVPWESYIQILPDMITYDNHSNDILSLYKEEVVHDKDNMVTLLASSRNISKHDVVRQLVEESIEVDGVIIRALQANSEALDAYMHFRAGFVGCQCFLSRYKLDELML